MKRRLILLLLPLSLLCPRAKAFLPPLASLLKESFSARHPNGATEVMFRHHIEARPGQIVILEERMLVDHGLYYFLWSGPPLPHPVGAELGRNQYVLGPSAAIPTRSALFNSYFGGTAAEGIKEILLREEFIRHDQFFQFVPGFIPEGDPETWNLREKYLRHPDIFLSRVGQAVTIEVVGVDDGVRKRAIYFDRGMRGIRRLEWRDNSYVATWTFEGFPAIDSASLPRRLSFEIEGAKVTSDLLSVRPLRGRQPVDWLASWRQAVKDPKASAAAVPVLNLLLSYR